METRAHHVMIGLFMLIASLALVVFVLWLSKATMDRDFVYYDVIFQDEVSGLSPGSAVEYSGINVGDVVNMKLDPDDPRVVQVRIRVASGTPIKEDTGARLGLANITGSAIIRLYGGSPESPILTSSGDRPPVIVAERSALNNLLANSEELIGGVNDFVENINSLFSEDNTELVVDILSNVEQVTGMLAEQQDELAATLQAFRTTMEQSERTLQEFSLFTQQGREFMQEQGPALFTSANNALQALDDSSQRFARLLDENEAALDSGLQGLHEFGPAVYELRRTLAALNRITRRFEEDPGSLLLQREEVKEFNP
ncbi:MlaD family protein [Aliidiomarina minuta]|nr:MlaD family protein [Aliidiomarina minuta]